MITPRTVLVSVLCVSPFALAPSTIGDQPTAQRDAGVTLRVYKIQQEPRTIPELAPDQTPNADELRPIVDFRGDAGFLNVPSPIYATVTGWIEAPVDGAYRFRLVSDDGSRLLLGGDLVVDNDGRHGERPRDSESITLVAGSHEFLIEYFDHVGQRMLRLEWLPPEDVRTAPGFVTVPSTALSTERDLTRVTSPGYKRLTDGLRSGDGLPVAGVHPSWDLSTIRPDDFEPLVGAMTFLPDGRLVVGTFDPLQRDERVLPDIESKVPDRLYALANVQEGDPTQITVTVIADDLFEPAGLAVVDGDLYVSQRREITRLRDLTGDGFFETHERVASGWQAWNYHEFTRGLVHHDGVLYAALTTVMAPPAWEGMETNSGPSGPLRGTIIAIELPGGSDESPSLGRVRAIAGGTRTPNGIGMIPALDDDPTDAPILLYTDNQGTWMPASQLSEVIPGRFYGHYNWTRLVPNLADRFPVGGHPSAFSDRPRTPATLLLPQNEVVNSPTNPIAIKDGIFAGQIFIGELTAGGIRRAFLERVNGQLQGALFRFTQGLEAGVNALVRGPDESLYVGGIGAGGNWNWRGTRHGLQRLTPNGRLTFEMHSVSARHDGFVVRFTKPVDPQWLAQPTNFRATQWRYAPTAAYGGPKVGTERLRVVAATPTDDGRSVHLTIDGLREGSCVHLRTDPTSVDGDEIWSTEAWYTLNAIPRRTPASPSRLGDLTIEPERSGVGVGVPPPADAATLIGQSPWDAMRFERRREAPPMLSQDDLIESTGEVGVGFGSGDLVSTTVFGDARIHVEFYCPPGGTGQLAANSGVYLQERYELQVLGTTPEQPPRLDELGAIYNVRAPDRNASTGPGTWQAYDIWFRAPRFVDGEKTEPARVTAYLNGVLIHEDAPIPAPTGAARAGGESPLRTDGPSHQVGPLRLQDHASQAEGPVRYRNIWIAPLESPEPSAARSGPWLDLLDESVTEWVPRGGEADFRVVEETDATTGESIRTIVGSTRPRTPNTFLTTTERFGDFEFVYEAKTHERLNSGVQIRSEVIGGFENRSGGLRGYQVELDPSPRAFSAGIYDERRRGWLHPLRGNPAARRAFKPNEWNTFHVLARGPLIQTWINGVPAATMLDAMDADGHIGLQVHSVGDEPEPLDVRFRNVRLRRLD